MKLVIGGATGFVGREVLRQALQCAEVTEIVTIGRRPVVVDDEQRSKITDIVMEAQDAFPDSVGRLIADSDACIWYGISDLIGFVFCFCGGCAEWMDGL